MKPQRLAFVAIIAIAMVAVTAIQAEYIPGELIVRFSHGNLDMSGTAEIPLAQARIQNQELASVLQSYNVRSVERVFKSTCVLEPPFTITKRGREIQLEDLSQVYILRLNPDLDIEQVAAQWRQMPGVIYAHPNYLSVPCATPNDPSFSLQWGLNNTTGNRWDINAPEAWEIQTGRSDVHLAIFDDGLEPEHFDDPGDEFNGRIHNNEYWDGRFKDTRPISELSAWSHHGTHVAGIAAAATNNGDPLGIGKGTAGVAGGWYPTNPGVSLLIATVNNSPAVDVAQAFLWAASEGGDVLNYSYGWVSPTDYELGVIRDAMEQCLRSDMAIFISSGNDDNFPVNSVAQPARLAKYDLCSAVGAIVQSGQRWIHSCHGKELTFVAPGVDIWSTYTSSLYYHASDGTSMASPFAAGTAALLYSQALDRGYTLLDVDCKRIMELSAKFNYYDYVPDTQTSIGPWNEEIGYGCVDAYAALRLLDDDCSLVHGTINDPFISIVPTTSATVVFDAPPLKGLLPGRYLAMVYKASGGIGVDPLHMLCGAWGRLYDGAPGYELDLTGNDAMSFVSRERNTDPNCAVFSTYIYELFGYDSDGDGNFNDSGETWPYSRWAPRDTSAVQIAYTYISTGIPTSPKDFIVESHALEPVLSVIGSNLGSSVAISYQLPAAIDARIAVYDVTGREVAALVSGKQTSGEHQITWGGVDNAGRHVQTGVYFIRMQAGDFQANEKVTLIR